MVAKRIQPCGLLDKIDKHLTSPLRLESRQRHFHPTQASCYDDNGQVHGTCLRKVGYEFYGVQKSNPFKPETLYTFAMGHHVEDMLVDWFKEMGLFVARNVKFFNSDFFVSGELDIVIRENPGSETLIGVESKSSHGPWFRTEIITGKPGTPPTPKSEHVMQVMLYLDNFPLPYFVLIYIGRDSFDRTEYTIRLVEENGDKYPEICYPDGSSYIDKRFSMANIYNRYKDMAAYLKKGVLPPRDYTPVMTQAEMEEAVKSGKAKAYQMTKFKNGELLTADWTCRYCDFKDLCRNVDAGEIPNFVERCNNKEFTKAEYKKPEITENMEKEVKKPVPPRNRTIKEGSRKIPS
jgi:hypothetical protein